MTVTEPPPPTIALTSPADNSAFTAPAAISLAANVAANGHAITKVQFFNGATLLGEDTTAPYAFTWNSVSAGNYTLTAQLVYDSGSILSSSAATVTVTNQLPPTIALTAPANDAAFTAPATISLPPTAPIRRHGHKVQFYNGATLLGETTTAPYASPGPMSPPATTASDGPGRLRLRQHRTSTVATVTVTPPCRPPSP